MGEVPLYVAISGVSREPPLAVNSNRSQTEARLRRGWRGPAGARQAPAERETTGYEASRKAHRVVAGEGWHVQSARGRGGDRMSF